MGNGTVSGFRVGGALAAPRRAQARNLQNEQTVPLPVAEIAGNRVLRLWRSLPARPMSLS